MDGPDLSVEVAGIRMKNPVMAASGTFGFAREHLRFIRTCDLGAVVVKGITAEPRAGNPPPRLAETEAGLLNSIGLENPGVRAFIADYLGELAGLDLPVLVNIAGETVEEYAYIARLLEAAGGMGGIEVNISCPNVARGGLSFGAVPEAAAAVVAAVRKCTRLPLIVKLPPQVLDIARLAREVADAGADAISLINAVPAMAIDIRTRRPKLGGVTGGLSGPAIKPIAVCLVWKVCRAVRLPVIGMGGIMSGEDAVEFLLAGATAVAVGTANLVDPTACAEVAEGIRRYLVEQGAKSVAEIVGRVET